MMVRRPSAPPLDGGGMEALADELKALAHVHRLRLLQLLTRPRYAEEIAEALQMTRPSALKHVERLERREFVRAYDGRRATGPVVEYVVNPRRLFAVGVRVSDLARIRPEGGPVHGDDDTTVTSVSTPSAPPDEPPARAVAHLLVADGPRAGTTLSLDGRSRWTIGRDEDRDLALPQDPFVSAHHAEIHRTAEGLQVADARSANGTYVNFQRIPPGGRRPLGIGDVLVVGGTAAVLQRPG